MPVYDGRFELEIVYTVTIGGVALTHRHSFDILCESDWPPGTDWGDINLLERSGLVVDITTFLQDYVDAWSPLLGTTTALQEIVLWRYDDEPSQSKIYIASSPTLPTTSFLGTSIAAAGLIMTFRVLGYRYPMRMYIMEGIVSGEQRVPAGSLSGAMLAYANYVISLASPILGRSDNPPIAVIAANAGQNEKLRNLRFR